jgi:chitin synthase
LRQPPRKVTIPETFRPALEAARRRIPHHTPLQPSQSLDGRFAPAEEVAGGWYVQTNDSGVLRRDWSPRRAEEGRSYYSRDSMESAYSRRSSLYSTYTPRRVESIVGFEDAVTYYNQQARQRPAGGAHFEDPGPQQAAMQSFINSPYEYKRPSVESVRSMASDGSVSLHFDVPLRQPVTSTTVFSAVPAPLTSHPPMHTTNTALLQERTQAHGNMYTAGTSSPLARKSFTRVATDDASSAAAESVGRVGRRHSSAGEERRGRRSISVGPDGRRRLSKTRVGGRANSQG